MGFVLHRRLGVGAVLLLVLAARAGLAQSEADAPRPTRPGPRDAGGVQPKEPVWPGLDRIRKQRWVEQWSFAAPSIRFKPGDHEKLSRIGAQCSDALAREQWRQDIVLQVWAPAHFDNCTFEAGADYVQSLLGDLDAALRLVDKLPPRQRVPQVVNALRYVGRALHGLQDFYSHSDYVERMHAAGVVFDPGTLVVPIWEAAGRRRLAELEGQGIVSGTFGNWPRNCPDGSRTHAQLAKDDTTFPSGASSLARWSRNGYSAAYDLADQASRAFLLYVYTTREVVKHTCGDRLSFLGAADSRPSK